MSPRATAEGVSALVLAAGLSRRMGGRNKLLLPVQGVPLIRHTVSVLLGAELVEAVVVTGHEAREVEAALEGLPVRLTHNPDYEDGQMSSVRAGLAALEQPSAGVLIGLGDQAFLTTEDVRAVVRAFCLQPRCQVLVPTHRGERGNPIVLSWGSLEAILARGVGFGCKQFVAKHADVVTLAEMASDRVLRDVDGPEDYAALTGLRL